MTDKTRLVIGNWKMTIDHDEGRKLIGDLKPVLVNAHLSGHEDNALTDPSTPKNATMNAAITQPVEVVVLPSFTAIHPVCVYARKHGIPVTIGAQTVSDVQEGAFTGDVSASMLAALGCKYVLVGHSERRRYHHEDGACIARKLRTVLSASMTPILCVGDSRTDFDAGEDMAWWAIENQLYPLIAPDITSKRVVVAYEPLWAIGTGETPSPAYIAKTVKNIKAFLGQARAVTSARHDGKTTPVEVLYGGSVNGDNAGALARIPGLDGVLIGGASVKAGPFGEIVQAFIG